ncbi:MAG: NUDIX hydrolase [Pseudomonadota bacterium]
MSGSGRRNGAHEQTERNTAEHLTARLTSADRDRSHPPIRVRDAASLIVYDPDGPKVLMGRRNARHAFMPNRFVFPGGRVDATDSRVPVARPFHDTTQQKLLAATRARHGVPRTRALGVAALREAFEETGVLIGAFGADRLPRTAPFEGFAKRGIGLDLSVMAFVARAITPPGRPRRYDTRFFMVPHTAIAAVDETVVGEDAELEEVAWVPIGEAKTMPLPVITVTVLEELEDRLQSDPHLSPEAPVPYYHWRGRGFVRELL